jgi:hypothetical protein
MSSKWQERPPRLIRDVLAYPKLQVDLGLKGRWFHKTSMAMTWGGPWFLWREQGMGNCAGMRHDCPIHFH